MEYFKIRSSTIVIKMKNIQVNETTEVLKEIIIRSFEQQIRKNEENGYKLQIRFKKYRRMESGILILGYVEQKIFELEEWIRINDGNFEGMERITKIKEFAIELFMYRQMRNV